MRRTAFLGLAIVSLGLVGCGDTTTGASSGSIVTTNVAPTSVVAQASADAAYEWTGTFTLSLTAGSAGLKVNAANAVVYQATGGIITSTLDAEHYRILANATTNHIDANATLPITYQVSYTVPDGSRGVLVRISLSVTDDNGNSTAGNVDVTVT